MPNDVRWVVVRNDFPKIIQGLEDRADMIVTKTAMDLEAAMKARAPVDTGFLRASIQASRKGKAHWEVVVGAEYGLYVEYGTAHTAPQPFVNPAVEFIRPVFLAAMRKVVRA